MRAVFPQLLIVWNEEGGDVTRLQAATGFILPGSIALGAAGDLVLNRRAAVALGRPGPLPELNSTWHPCWTWPLSPTTR